MALCLNQAPATGQYVKTDNIGNITLDGASRMSIGQKPRSGAVLSPWAPATDLSAMAAIAAKRPPQAQQDALASWIADQHTRDTNQPIAPKDLKDQRDAFDLRQGFFSRDDASGLWIANRHVGLRFETASGHYNLVSLYHLPHGIELIGQRAANGSVFDVLVLRYKKDGTTGVNNFGPQYETASSDLSTLTGIGAQAAEQASHKVSWDAQGLLLQLTFSGIRVPETPGSLRVQVQVRLGHDDGLTRWKSQVSGQLPRAGLAMLRCPRIAGFGYSGQVDTVYAWGSQRGVIKRGDSSVSQGTYPSSQWSMQHLSVSFGPDTVCYIATHDPDLYVKQFKIQPGSELAIGMWAPNTGVRGNAKCKTPYETVIGPMPGNWFDAAQHYRVWAIDTAPWAKRPLKDRDDLSTRMLKTSYWGRAAWIGPSEATGDETYSFDNALRRMPPKQTLDWYHEALGVPYDRLGMIHYGWQEQLWDTKLPYWTPFSPQIAEELKRETDLGVSTIVYTNPCWIDANTPQFKEPQVQASLTRNIDGSLYTEQYNAKMYEINRTTPFFKQVALKLAQTAHTMGSNGVYYDQLSGLIRGGDYDTAKGLANLGKGGNWLPQARRDAMAYVRDAMGSEFGFASEFFTETSLDRYDAHSMTVHGDPYEIPLIPAVYGGYAVLFGSGLHLETQPTSATVSLGRSFLWGTAHGWTQYAIEIKRQHTRLLLRQLVQLRRQLDDFVIYGRLLPPPPTTGPVGEIKLDAWNVFGSLRPVETVDACETTMWQSDNGRRVLLVLN